MNASVSHPDKELFWNLTRMALAGARDATSPSAHALVLKRSRNEANTTAYRTSGCRCSRKANHRRMSREMAHNGSG
jgi:hypothetical protein